MSVEQERKEKGFILSVFPGIGRTYAMEKYKGKKLSRLESSDFVEFIDGKEKFDEEKYLNAILNSSLENDFTLLDCTKLTLDLLFKNEIKIDVCIPANWPNGQTKDIFLKRYKAQGKKEDFIKNMDENWNSIINDLNDYLGSQNACGCWTSTFHDGFLMPHLVLSPRFNREMYEQMFKKRSLIFND